MALSSRDIQFRELKDMLVQLNKTVEAQTQLIASLQKSLQEAEALAARRQEQIEYLTRKLYGSSSEKQPKQADGQLTLFDMFAHLFDEAEYDHDPAAPEEETVIIREHTRKAKRSNKDKFKDLQVEEIIIDLPEEDQSCSVCGTPMEKVGREYVREELVYVPAELKLVKYYRTTYKCPKCTDGFTPDVEHVFVKSEVPKALIPHSYASGSIVAWCMYQKYGLAIPLYRQEQDWLQFNVELSRTTMANWIIYCVEHYLIHLYDHLHRELLKREFLMADETRVQVLREPDRRAQTKSYMWLVRSGEDGLPTIILFGYTETRARYNIENFLEGYPGGYLETDGYQGYNKLKNIKRCCCWSHYSSYIVIPEILSRAA